VPSTETHVSVGLVYQAAALNAHLKQALSELGARVVYDRPAAEFVYADLDATGAEVVVVNLDPDVGDEFAALDDLLTDESRRVVFNDGEVSSRLAGWDQARWARHLAAKIMGSDGNHAAAPGRVAGGAGARQGRVGASRRPCPRAASRSRPTLFTARSKPTCTTRSGASAPR
jgi:hypothetical protein